MEMEMEEVEGGRNRERGRAGRVWEREQELGGVGGDRISVLMLRWGEVDVGVLIGEKEIVGPGPLLKRGRRIGIVDLTVCFFDFSTFRFILQNVQASEWIVFLARDLDFLFAVYTLNAITTINAGLYMKPPRSQFLHSLARPGSN